MHTAAGALAFFLLAGAVQAADKVGEAPAPLGIDHVGIGVADLDRGIAQIASRTGVTAVKGGVHPGGGTQNALMSLGKATYLEILAPVPGEKVSEPLAFLAKLEKPTPLFFAVHSTDLEATKRQLESSGFATTKIEPGSRKKPDGTVLGWRTFGVTGPGLDQAPFFIEWGKGSPHPSETSPGGCTLARLEVRDRDTARLDALVETLGVPAAVGAADSPGLRVTLACPRGEVVFEK